MGTSVQKNNNPDVKRKEVVTGNSVFSFEQFSFAWQFNILC